MYCKYNTLLEFKISLTTDHIPEVNSPNAKILRELLFVKLVMINHHYYVIRPLML